MAIKNRDYWQRRMAAVEESGYQSGAAFYKDVQEQYRKALFDLQMDVRVWYQRLADNNEISYAGAKKLLKKDELEEFKWTVEQYIKAGEENAIDQRWMKELENASAKYHISRLEAMKLQIQQHAELLSAQMESGMTEYLHKSYGNQYYRTAFEIVRGTSIGSDLTKIDNRKVDLLLKKPWARDGKNFSDRIWTNKDKLINNLHTELTQSVIRGEAPQKAIDRLSKTMNVSKSQAGNLIMTETAAISSRAQQDCFKELGVEEFEVIETLDGKTCAICQEMDGKHFPMSDYRVGETAPPFHPRCRGCTAPYFDDEFNQMEERAARDPKTGKTVYVSADMNYKDWKRTIDGGGDLEKFVAKASDSGIIKSESTKEAADVHLIGKIDRGIYSCVTKDIRTDEVVITDNQIQHIKERHPEAFEKAMRDVKSTIENPDYIIADDKHKNTGLVIRNIKREEEHLLLVLRICTSVDEPGYKNSVISSWEISERRLQNYLRNKRILYKKE